MEEGGGIGWDGVEGWGENADNCNSITIKKLKKKKKESQMSIKHTDPSCLSSFLAPFLQLKEDSSSLPVTLPTFKQEQFV